MSEVNEDLTKPIEVSHPAIEIVEFTGNDGDHYLSKKFGILDAAFACNETTDNKEIQVSWETLGNGQPRINLNMEENNTKGFLLIIGRK